MRKLFWLIVLPVLLYLPVISAQGDEEQSTLIAYVSNENGHEDIFLMSQEGESAFRVRLTSSPANDWNPRWSPDGTQILFNSDRDGMDALYIMDSNGANVRPLFVSGKSNDYDGVWSPDGNRILFVSDRSGIGRDIYVTDRDGSVVERITDLNRIIGDPYWSTDGSAILYWDQDNTGQIQIYRLNLATNQSARVTFTSNVNGSGIWAKTNDYIYYDLEQDGEWRIYRAQTNGNFPEQVSESGYNSGRATLSPNGSRLAYVTDRHESDEIYVMNSNGTGQVRLTNNTHADYSPDWQPIVPSFQSAEVTEPTPLMDTSDDSDLFGPAVGQSVGGIETHIIEMRTLLQQYGISDWHDKGFYGEGINIGVMDTAFGNLSAYIDATDSLPDVTIPPDHDIANYNANNNDHGTDVIEVIHTVAPRARVFACQYSGIFEEFRFCYDWLRQNKVKVINHSVGLPILPLDGTNNWSDLIQQQSLADNILWINSAGNFDRGYYIGQFSDVDNNGMHNFGAVDNQVIVDTNGDSYSGSIILSWEDWRDFEIDDLEGVRRRFNFDIEIVGEISGQTLNLTEGRKNQQSDGTIPAYEVIRLTNVQERFVIRIVDNYENLEDYEVSPEGAQIALFVEFATLDKRSNKGSVIAPGDAKDAITVGSINGLDQLAVYSSRGLDITTWNKPDLSAPGELKLADGTQFVGTSAAAPVFAGVSALIFETTLMDAGQLSVALRDNPDVYLNRVNDASYGLGTLKLRPLEIRNLQEGETLVEPKVVFPQAIEEPIVEFTGCPGALDSRLEVGVPGYVTYDLGFRLRATPSFQGRVVEERIEAGQRFNVTGGPECIGSVTWWKVDLEISNTGDGGEGWFAEAEDFYYLAPVSLERGKLPKVYPYDDNTCPNALNPQLEIGGRGRVLRGNQEFFRDEFFNFSHYRGSLLAQGTIVHVLGGPLCGGPERDLLRWYIRVIEGTNPGFEGWIIEGDVNTRVIEVID